MPGMLGFPSVGVRPDDKVRVPVRNWHCGVWRRIVAAKGGNLEGRHHAIVAVVWSTGKPIARRIGEQKNRCRPGRDGRGAADLCDAVIGTGRVWPRDYGGPDGDERRPGRMSSGDSRWVHEYRRRVVHQGVSADERGSCVRGCDRHNRDRQSTRGWATFRGDIARPGFGAGINSLFASQLPAAAISGSDGTHFHERDASRVIDAGSTDGCRGQGEIVSSWATHRLWVGSVLGATN